MRTDRLTLVIAAIIMMMLSPMIAAAQPTGATVPYNYTETKLPAPAGFVNTSGGTFTTLILSAESQNPRWKAYAGNVTGTLVLDDAGDYSIYQWNLVSTTGEVYASRSNSITWSGMQCAQNAHITAEQTAMSHTASAEDNILNTFPYQIHREFWVGTRRIQQNTCRSTVTWANNTAQAPSADAPFQEMLLTDGTNFVYSTIIQNNAQGFNFKKYDFQMIVAEKNLPGPQATPYYFYLELA